MGYNDKDYNSGFARPRSRKRGQGASRETLPVRPSSPQEIPPPGGWEGTGSHSIQPGFSHSTRGSQKPALDLDPSLKNGGRKGMSKTKRRIITMLIAECFALLFIGGYGYWARTWNQIQRVDDWIPEEIQNQNFSVDLPQYEKQKGHWGIYIFGVDSRGSNVGKDTHSDVNIVCDINHDTGEIRLVSVFRDSYLNINEKNEYNKINQAYFRGGPAEAAKALNKNLDLNIVDYVTFSWKAVADGINLLGGVDMEISNAEFAYINSFITETVEATGVYSQHLKGPGLQHLDGVQAVAYGRLRLMDTDYARTERQRKVIKAAFEKAKSADLSTLNQLAMLLFPQVATSVDLQDILQLLGNVGKYHIGETGGFPFARGDANMGRKGACVIPQTLESNVIELHEFLYGQENYTPSDTVKTISTKISSDTGMYTQGVSIDHVSTSGGSVPRPAKQETSGAKETTAGTKESQEDEDEVEEVEETTMEDSRLPGGTTAPPTSTIYPDDGPSKPSRPKETESATKAPTAPSSSTTSPTAPSSTAPRPTAPAHPESSQGTTVPNVPHPGSATTQTDSHPTEGNGPSSNPSSSQPGSVSPGGNTPSNGNGPTSGNAPSGGNTPSVPAPPGSSPSGSPSAGTTPGVPNGATSVVIPDGQVISYDGPPGTGN